MNPTLVSKNRFEGLPVEEIVNTDDIVTDHVVVPNGRGSQETELGAPEACLIPILLESTRVAEPKRDKKFFIRSARIEKEIMLKVGL